MSISEVIRDMEREMFQRTVSSKCYATIDRICETEEMAVELWNRRVRRCHKGN